MKKRNNYKSSNVNIRVYTSQRVRSVAVDSWEGQNPGAGKKYGHMWLRRAAILALAVKIGISTFFLQNEKKADLTIEELIPY